MALGTSVKNVLPTYAMYDITIPCKKICIVTSVIDQSFPGDDNSLQFENVFHHDNNYRFLAIYFRMFAISI